MARFGGGRFGDGERWAEFNNLSLEDINCKINITSQQLVDVISKINTVDLEQADVSNNIVFVNGGLVDFTNDTRTKSRTLTNINNDIRTKASWQIPSAGDIDALSLGKEYIKVYINSVEQTDADVNSIKIQQSANTSHTATFSLNRVYDSGTKPSLDQTVEIKYHVFTLYTGYVSSISPGDSPESIKVNSKDEYWKQNRTKKYFFVGHQPPNNYDTYYETIQQGLATGIGWNPGSLGILTPELLECFGQGASDVTSKLINECGNYGWFYTPNGTRKLVTYGEGDVINLQRQSIGSNLGLYQVLSHKISESADNIINKFRVQMGGRTEKYIHDNNAYDDFGQSPVDSGVKHYSGIAHVHDSSYVTPAWASDYEILAHGNQLGYGIDYYKALVDAGYNDVFRKYYLQDLNQRYESYSDRYPPEVRMYAIYGNSVHNLPQTTVKIIKEGFTIDYENKLLIFQYPVFMYRRDLTGEIYAVRAPLLQINIWKKHSYSFSDPTEANPDPDPGDFDPETDITNPLMFFTNKMGTFPETVIDILNLPNLTFQTGGSYHDSENNLITIPSWNDTNFAEDYAEWKLTQTADVKTTGNIKVTIDTMCLHNIDLSKKIKVNDMIDTSINIRSIMYNISDFTATIELESRRGYTRTKSLQVRG